jgi:hypothetical protein
MVNRSPRPYRYTLLWNDGTTDQTTVLAKDPVGWSEHNISFTRSEDFGLDTEYVVPLSFSGQGYNILKSVFERTGAFSVVRVRIEKRNNNWQYYQIYLYRLDFKSYKDNFSTIEIEGIDDSLLSKISANADKEFEIDLPATNKTLIEYTGVTLIKKNLIQCGYGKLERKSNIETLAFLLKGTRTIRNYTEYFQFTDENGTPYETMTFKVLKTVTQDIEYHLNITIKQNDSSGIPPSGSIKFYKHDANFQNPTLLTDGSLNDVVFASSRSETGGGFFTGYYNNDTFEYSGTIIGANLNAGEYISVFFSSLSFVTVSIIDGFDCYISLNSMSESPYENAIIEVFTFEWVISQLLKKINSNAILNYRLPDIGYVPVLSCTQAIRNIGKTNGTGKFKAKLKDVLKALNYSYCIAIDISGNTLSVYERSEVYNTTNKGELTVNNIVSEYDDTHCYNTVKVGGKTKDEYKTKVYPFNCIKTFRIPDTLAEKEYDLQHPFEIDCYSIEEMIQETLDKANADNKDKTDFFVLACYETSIKAKIREEYKEIPGNYLNNPYFTFFDTIPVDPEIPYIQFNEINSTYVSLESDNTKIVYDFSDSTTMSLSIQIDCTILTWDERVEDYFGLRILEGTYTPIINDISFETTEFNEYENMTLYKTNYKVNILLQLLDVEVEDKTIIFDFISNIQWYKLIFNKFEIVFDKKYILYNNITSISNFEGDSATIYNLPLSPKRTLLKHLPYISISKWGSEGNIEFETSDRDTNITCQLGYELGEITENDSVEPVTPLFLPVRYTFDTQKEDSSIFDVYGEKYGYYTLTHKKSGKSVSGWVNKAIFAVSKRKQQSWELQAKTI